MESLAPWLDCRDCATAKYDGLPVRLRLSYSTGRVFYYDAAGSANNHHPNLGQGGNIVQLLHRQVTQDLTTDNLRGCLGFPHQPFAFSTRLLAVSQRDKSQSERYDQQPPCNRHSPCLHHHLPRRLLRCRDEGWAALLRRHHLPADYHRDRREEEWEG